MKVKGGYNPVTESADVEYNYSAADHREGRKDTLLAGAVVLVILGAVAYLVYLAFKGATATTDGIKKTLTDLIPDMPEIPDFSGKNTQAAAVEGGNKATPAATDATNIFGKYYPVKTLTTADYNSMLDQIGVARVLVDAGNAITPPTIINSAAFAGSQAAETVNKNGLNDAYVDLPFVAKGLVTLGEGIGMVAGVDLIQLGHDARSQTAASQTATQPRAGFAGLW